MGSRRELSVLALAILAIGLVSKTNGAPRNGLFEPHIVDGTSTPIEKIPYQISLEYHWRHSCGGAIIGKWHVLTAAHCVEGSDRHSGLRIRAGSTVQIPYINFFGGVIHHIESIKLHPSYNTTIMDYDVAVITVQKGFVFESRIQPISVSVESEDTFIDYDQPFKVSGWGGTSANSLWFWPQIWLLSIEIPPVRRQDCLKSYANSTAEVVTPRMICGGYITQGSAKTPCYGDSGGPMTHRNQLVGLVSWGRNCDASKPSVYTNLLHYDIRHFIRTQAGV